MVWICSACTFENTSDVAWVCAVCEAKKEEPQEAAPRKRTFALIENKKDNKKELGYKKGKLSKSDNSNAASSFRQCPICELGVAYHKFISHVEECQGAKAEFSAKGGAKPPFVPTSSEPLPGLLVFKNFLPAEENQKILECLEQQHSSNWRKTSFNGTCDVIRFGANPPYNFSTGIPVTSSEMPSDIYGALFSTMKQQKYAEYTGKTPNESNLMRYRRDRNDWLKAHVDDRNISGPISNYSLKGSCEMTYDLIDKSRRTKETKGLSSNISLPETVNVRLEPGTLQVMTGVARYDYTHSISNENLFSDERISITMRNSKLK